VGELRELKVGFLDRTRVVISRDLLRHMKKFKVIELVNVLRQEDQLSLLSDGEVTTRKQQALIKLIATITP
jgi:hypothetical protein